MKKLLLFLSLLLCVPANADEAIGDAKNVTQPVSSSMTKMEKRVRNAAVKVHAGNGHGSGSLIKFKGSHFVVTANHVINSKSARAYFGAQYQIKGTNETNVGTLVYFDPQYDIAVLFLDKKEHFFYNEPMKWNPLDEMPEVGTDITYSGYPSWHNLMTFRGRVAGYEIFPEIGPQVLLNVFGWFGSSGSVVYTKKGQIVGVLWAVDVEQNPTFQVNEDMVWVSPAKNLDMNKAYDSVCRHAANPPKNCD